MSHKEFKEQYYDYREKKRKQYSVRPQLPLYIHEGSFLYTLDDKLNDGCNPFEDEYIPTIIKGGYKDTYGVTEFSRSIQIERQRQRDAQKSGAIISVKIDNFWTELFK